MIRNLTILADSVCWLGEWSNRASGMSSFVTSSGINTVRLVKGHNARAAATDKPIAGLLTDLRRRGLLDRTLVLWGGEFGRTPDTAKEDLDGRDHNPNGYTMWLAGGGVKPGFQHGATDELGYEAVEGRVHLHDLHATILHLMGLDHKRLTHRYAGRDFRLTDVHGRVVDEILA